MNKSFFYKTILFLHSIHLNVDYKLQGVTKKNKLVVKQLGPDLIKKSVFDLRDRAQKVVNAKGGYIEKG